MDRPINEVRVRSRLAVEALRSGVPNRYAIEELGCSQPLVEQEFGRMLDAAQSANGSESRQGMLVDGDFGAGKSHLLGWLQEQALLRGFACSRVVISKETPLFDLGQVFKAAVANAVIPNVEVGEMVEELALRLQNKVNSESYRSFYLWVNQESTNLHPMFPATLAVHHYLNNDLEMLRDVHAFWSGEKIGATRVNQALREAGQHRAHPKVRAPKVAELPPQRLRFLMEMVKAAGYRGWVVLLDEIELISNYSKLQRARSYAELARWMGLAVGEDYPGLVVVGTLTPDFAAKVLDEKGDRQTASDDLRSRQRDAEAARAEGGMRFLEREAYSLNEPDSDTLYALCEKLRVLHSRAYDWEAPVIAWDTPSATGHGSSTRVMRGYVRRWITVWDLRRLYGIEDPDIEEHRHEPSYNEDPELEKPSHDQDDAPDIEKPPEDDGAG